MAFSAHDRVEPVPGAVRADLPLTPQEYFVLSRIEQRVAVSEIPSRVGLADEDVHRALAKLLSLGLVRLAGRPRDEAVRPGPRRGKGDPRKRALLGQFAASFSQGAGGSERPVRRGAPEGARPAPAEGARRPPVDEDVWASIRAACDPSRLDPDSPIPEDEQRLLLGLVARGDKLSAFDLLGIPPTNDERTIRRAYLRASRHFHPDRYYGKDLGPFGPMLADLFERSRRAYQALLDPARRAAYLRALEERAGGPQDAEAEPDAATCTDEDRRRAEEEARRRQARKARDEARRRRQQRRLRQELRAKAQAHYARGTEAEAAEDFSNAAIAYRLASEIDPANETYRRAYERARARVRKVRCETLVARGWSKLELGDTAGAAEAFRAAAELDHSPEHLALAAWAHAALDPSMAEAYAMEALAELSNVLGRGSAGLSAAAEARIRAMAARGLAVGGRHHLTAEQIRRAEALAGDDPKVRSLLEALKEA